MKHNRATRIFVLLVLLVDVVASVAAFALAFFLRQLIPLPRVVGEVGPFVEYLPMLAIHTLSIALVFFFARLYNLQRASRIDEIYGVVAGVTVGTLMGVAVAALALQDFSIGRDYSRGMVLYAWLLSIILVTSGRLFNGWLRQHLVRRGWGRRRVAVIGLGDIARMIVQKILWTPELGYDLIGVLGNNGSQVDNLLGVPMVGNAMDLTSIIEEHEVEEIIIALPEETSHQEILWLISECERGRVTIRVYPDLFQIMAGPVSIGEMGGVPLLTVRDIAQTGWRNTAKRVMDIVVAGTALIIGSPLMLFIALIIKLESPGPVFYVQERMGLDARPFPILKFRSMRSDAEKAGPGWTRPDDPRRTRVGSFLRATNLDELPQFVNVLLGDMSVVGPRPERPVYVEQFRRSIPRYMERHREKAGLTGWAQVNGFRGDTSISERTKYDLWYIENWSLILDVKIIIRTVLQIFRSPNAY